MSLENIKKDVHNRILIHKIYIAKILRKIEMLVLNINNKHTCYFRNSLADLAEYVFSKQKGSIKQLSSYLQYPHEYSNNIKKRNDYIRDVYTELIKTDISQESIKNLEILDLKLSKLTNILLDR